MAKYNHLTPLPFKGLTENRKILFIPYRWMILLYEMPQKVKNAAVETRTLGERFNVDSFLAIMDKLVVALTVRLLVFLF